MAHGYPSPRTILAAALGRHVALLPFTGQLAMPMYFFDLHDGVEVIDEDGTELRDIEHAKEEAALFAGGLLRDQPKRFWSGEEWTIRVRDETGLMLFDLTFLGNLAPALRRVTSDA